MNCLHGTLKPLHCACMVADADCVELLLQKGAEVKLWKNRKQVENTEKRGKEGGSGGADKELGLELMGLSLILGKSFYQKKCCGAQASGIGVWPTFLA